ncbi:MAG: DegT/DnrJ/EryC1/StrS family aminotransferase [Saprospiraceae bacterium]|nr:DegT/DnrJ/EryC1/StrS family aminotransferase [Saprospiraceae bacterium]
MVDTYGQYQKIKEEVDREVIAVMESTRFIGGQKVAGLAENLATYLGVKHVIPCANGTDALQIALMALGLQPGDEVIVPAFTYVATAEVIALLRLTPVMVDVDKDTFNLEVSELERVLSAKTKAIVPVHLYGQSANMEPIMDFAKKHDLFVVEDNAQAIGATYTFSDGRTAKTGTIGHVGCTSFYPSKNLGAFGDGGAMMTNDDELAGRLRMIANHGQSKRYYHDSIGCNSRLDAMQAAILDVKLRHLDEYSKARNWAANQYDLAFTNMDQIIRPVRATNSDHVFHQYTVKLTNGRRTELQTYLKEQGIPSMIYYPVPLYKQKAYDHYWTAGETLPATEVLCDQVISLPMHTELNEEIIHHISSHVKNFLS